MPDKPELFFRRRERGAGVYRVETGNTGRMDLQQIAIVKPNGEVKPVGRHEPTEAEQALIADWISTETARQNARDAARMDRLLGELNMAAQWLQSEVPDSMIAENAQDLLLSIHDLRSTIVKRLAKNT